MAGVEGTSDAAPPDATTPSAELLTQLSLMKTMEELAKVGAWRIDLKTAQVDSSPGVHQVFEVGPEARDTVAEAMARCLPEYRPHLEATVNNAYAKGVPYNVERPFLTHTGRTIWVRAVGDPVRQGDAVVGYRGVLVDVTTEHNALEEVQLLNAELEQRVALRTAALAAANTELESFSYSVSHDLRSPLRAISGFAQLLTTRFGESLDPKAQHYLQNIRTASDHMGILIEELLEYSRLGYEPAVTRPVALAPLLDRLSHTFASEIETLGATIDFTLPMPTPMADFTLLEQILNNLVGNALKYRRPDIPPVVRITAQERDGVVDIVISDNGIGIAPEYHERIFEVFQRLHTDAEFPGTGIGLASARKAAGRMAGTITVASTPGTGSTFTLSLPLAMTESVAGVPGSNEDL